MRPGKGMRQSGFTLIELMAVIVILSLVMVVVAVNVADRIEWARVETTKLRMRLVGNGLEMYRVENALYPTTEQGLTALVERPEAKPAPRVYPASGYLGDREALNDGWSRPLGYESPGVRRPRSYDLWSLGSDARPGGEGPSADLTNWEERG